MSTSLQAPESGKLRRVLLSPRAALCPQACGVAEALSQPGGAVYRLDSLALRNLNRRLSPAEVFGIRRLLGCVGGEAMGTARVEGDESVVGYCCMGRMLRPLPERRAYAVADHVNLTFLSPLEGTNDEELGPRFPATADLYRPRFVQERYPVFSGVVAEVGDTQRLSQFEDRTLSLAGRVLAITNELAAVAIIAAHGGVKLAAVVVAEQCDTQ